MKKAAILTVLSVFFFVASYAQDSKMTASPAYDNVNKEKEWNLHKIPARCKFTLEDAEFREGNKFMPMPVSRVNLLDPGQYKTNRELTRYDIKTVTFPKKAK